MTTTKTEPTDEQLREYATKLPEVYKHVLYAFPRLQSPRRHGDALSLESIDRYLTQAYDVYREGDTEEAVDQLVAGRFLERLDMPLLVYAPTDLGERLINAVTGVSSAPKRVPKLPEPTWAA